MSNMTMWHPCGPVLPMIYIIFHHRNHKNGNFTQTKDIPVGMSHPRYLSASLLSSWLYKSWKWQYHPNKGHPCGPSHQGLCWLQVSNALPRLRVDQAYHIENIENMYNIKSWAAKKNYRKYWKYQHYYEMLYYSCWPGSCRGSPCTTLSRSRVRSGRNQREKWLCRWGLFK